MKDPYRQLADRLDELPNGFPRVEDGADLRLLAKLFTPQEAELTAQLRPTLETAKEISKRIGQDQVTVRQTLKSLARRGLINCQKIKSGLGFGLMPFVVGFYENQIVSMDVELAQLFEDYYQKAAKQLLSIQPQVHRIVPVNETIRNDMEIYPYESVLSLLDRAQAWGVVDCICRKQKILIGEPCQHPVDVCMVLSPHPSAFDNSSVVRALSQEQALDTLRRAAEAGLVHSVNNTQEDIWYICNCCICSCGILRGIKELGLANVVARSAFVNTVQEENCIGCESCVTACQFNALSYNGTAKVDVNKCVGCGVCVVTCPEGALSLIRRSDTQNIVPLVNNEAWGLERARARGIHF